MKFVLNNSNKAGAGGVALLAALLLASKKAATVDAAGVGTFFTYYEEGGFGPSNWANLHIDGNQCGGTNGASGYGQSPITIDFETTDQCMTDMSAYEFDGGDCTWDDLKFSIGNNGVKAEPKTPGACNFGQMSIPHTSNKFNALQFHIHTYSEHQIEGIGHGGFFPAELHVVHQEVTEESFAVFGTMIDVGTEPHEMFEMFLQGWEAVAQTVEDSCAAFVEPSIRRGLNEEGEGSGTSTSGAHHATVQKLLECAAPGTAFYTNVTTPIFPTDIMPNVYDLPTNKEFGIYTYKGGLTTPACTEIVNWNFLDAPMLISDDQLHRLLKLILCYVSKEYLDDHVTVSGCALGTVASEDGSTSRPPQDKMGRRVIHRCRDGPPIEIPDIGVLPPDDSESEFVKPDPPVEPSNTGSAKCQKNLFKDCSQDKRYDPAASPNLRVNNPTWNDLEGLWVGKVLSYDAEGNPLEPQFASTKVNNTIPYTRNEITIFINRTIDQTRYYEHVYRVYGPASEKFCSLPVPDQASNHIGSGICGINGYVETAAIYGMATHEKDGLASIFFASGRDAGGKGSVDPIGGLTMHSSLKGYGFKTSETYTFVNDAKTAMSGSGQYFIISDVPPYSENPLAESFVVHLHQVSEDDFTLALNDAYDENDVPENDRFPATVPGDCFKGSRCPTQEDFDAVDPLKTVSPYESEASVKGGFIFLFALIAFAVVFGVLYYLHNAALNKQSERYRNQFAAAIAETIHLDGVSPQELEKEFKRIDTNNDGCLSKKELRTFMSTMDQRDFDAMFAAIDIDGSGTVEYAEFCAFIAHISRGPPKNPPKPEGPLPPNEVDAIDC